MSPLTLSIASSGKAAVQTVTIHNKGGQVLHVEAQLELTVRSAPHHGLCGHLSRPFESLKYKRASKLGFKTRMPHAHL